MRPRRALLLLLLVAVVLPSSATAAPGAISVSLVPADDGSDDPRARHYVVAAVAPGGTLSRELVVGNSTDATLILRSYVQGATVADGRFDFRPPADDDLAAWARTSPADPVVRAGGTVRLSLRVDVPDGQQPGSATAWRGWSCGGRSGALPSPPGSASASTCGSVSGSHVRTS